MPTFTWPTFNWDLPWSTYALWLYYFLLLAASFLGLLLAILGLPGIWLIVIVTAVYAFLAGSLNLAICVAVLLALGIVAELLETALGGAAAKKAGASKRGIFAAIVGGLIGGLVATFLIPIPIIGTLLGACAGAFLLAFAVELLWLKRTGEDALAIGVASAKGRLYGLVTKLAVGVVMLLTTAIWSFPPFHSNTTAAALPPPTTTTPTTTPAP